MILFGKKNLFRPAKWQETTQPLLNPWRGMYTIYRLDATTDVLPQFSLPYSACTRTADETLALVEVNLAAYRESAIADTALDRIDRALAHFHSLGLDLIVRFLYDWDGQGIQHEPLVLQTILDHMQQLSPLLKRHTEAIFILQGLLIGSWGEMHCTRFSSERDMTKLMQTMAEVSGEKTFLAVRCPNIWRNVHRSFQPLEEREAYTTTAKARTGLFNDAIMGSETDLGTYGSTSRELATNLQAKYLPEEELGFQSQLCRYVPNGGEVVNASALNASSRAIQTLRQMHATYLNDAYDPEVLAQWKASTISERHSVWNGHTAYDYIAAHLGYRYLVQEVTAVKRKELPGHALLTIHLVNSGFAPCYRPVSVSVCLQGDNGMQEFPVSTDIRHWQPQAPVQLQALVPIDGKERPLGLLLRTEDGRELRLANTSAQGQITNYLGGLRA